MEFFAVTLRNPNIGEDGLKRRYFISEQKADEYKQDLCKLPCGIGWYPIKLYLETED